MSRGPRVLRVSESKATKQERLRKSNCQAISMIYFRRYPDIAVPLKFLFWFFSFYFGFLVCKTNTKEI